MATAKTSSDARRSGAFAILATLMLVVSPEMATPQQPISGNYAPGAFTGIKGALQPPAGTVVIENGTLFYATRDFVNSSGDPIRIETVNGLGNRTVIGYVTDFQILGGDYFPAVILPLANVALRPEPGSKKDFQFGDMIIQPFALGWHKDEWHFQAVYNLWLPTGRFNEGAPNNVGKGLVSHMLTGGVTWLQDTENPWAATFMARYEFLGEQQDTEIEPGQVLTLEGGIGKEVLGGVDLGLVGYATFQTTRESGSSPTTDTSRYRAFSLGPEITWRPSFLPGSKVTVQSFFEFGARNTTEGVFTVLSLAYAF